MARRAPTRRALVRQGGRVAQRQEAAPSALIAELTSPVRFQRGWAFECVWRCFLLLRNPAGARARGRVTRNYVQEGRFGSSSAPARSLAAGALDRAPGSPRSGRLSVAAHFGFGG